MDSLSQPNFITPEQEQALQNLAWSIEASEGEFLLIFAHCNYVNLQQLFSERLNKLCSVETVYIRSTDQQLYTAIKSQIQGTPKAVQVLGLDQVNLLEEVLKSADRVRDEFKKNLSFPLVIWVNNNIQTLLIQLAPNFESWGVTQTFPVTVEYINDFLMDKVDSIVNSEVKLSRQDVDSLEQEVIAAGEYLEAREPELEFYIHFLLGYVKEIYKDVDQAIADYQTARNYLDLSALTLEFKAGLLVHLTYCYYLKAGQTKDIQDVNKWQQTREYVEETLEVFGQLNNIKFAAKSLYLLGRVFIQLEYWAKLKEFADIGLQLHQTEQNYYKIAQDYVFFAEFCLSQKDWHEGINLAEQGLKELEKVENSSTLDVETLYITSLQRSKLLLIIGRGKAALGEFIEAINTLNTAKSYNLNLDEPDVYIEVLKQLHNLYFEQTKEYLTAFIIGQEIVKAERQAGQFAFIGISQIPLPITISENQETIAPEIVASGRENDVKKLVERVIRNDYKVIVIYGESGVGKSSLVVKVQDADKKVQHADTQRKNAENGLSRIYGDKHGLLK